MHSTLTLTPGDTIGVRNEGALMRWTIIVGTFDLFAERVPNVLVENVHPHRATNLGVVREVNGSALPMLVA